MKTFNMEKSVITRLVLTSSISAQFWYITIYRSIHFRENLLDCRVCIAKMSCDSSRLYNRNLKTNAVEVDLFTHPRAKDIVY